MNKNQNQLVGELIIATLIQRGVDYFCISPGSRSTPLTAAVARNENATSIICYDERGCAFHGLGYSKGRGKPACVITTSGTAVANLFPAIIEASQSETPLIILTADRPSELRGTDANQTINQEKIFSDYVRSFIDLECFGDVKSETIDEIIETAIVKQGPVHINCQFRKPFLENTNG